MIATKLDMRSLPEVDSSPRGGFKSLFGFFLSLLLLSGMAMTAYGDGEGSGVERILEIVAISDAHVLSGFLQNSNFGFEEILLIGDKMQAFAFLADKSVVYIKFDIAEIRKLKGIQKVELILRMQFVLQESIICVHLSRDGSWDEYQITWRNQPGFELKSLSCVDVKDSEREYVWDITEAITPLIQSGETEVTLVLQSITPGMVYLYPRETAHGPRLKVSFVSETEATVDSTYLTYAILFLVTVLLTYFLSRGGRGLMQSKSFIGYQTIYPNNT